LRLGAATAALQMKVLFIFLFWFYLRRGVDKRACTLLGDFGGVDPDGWFNQMVDELYVVLSYLLNFDTQVAIMVLRGIILLLVWVGDAE